MKYRLLKPIDICVAGDIFEVQNAGNNCFPKRTWLDCRRTFFALPIELASDPDWFEEVKAFVPKASETFWYVGAPLVPMIAVLEGLGSDFSEDILKIGNCFRTEADAEACAVEMRKMLNNWREDHP